MVCVTEVASLMEGEWSCYEVASLDGGVQFERGIWSC